MMHPYASNFQESEARLSQLLKQLGWPAHHALQRGVARAARRVVGDAVGVKVALVKYALLARGQPVAVGDARACAQ